MTKYEVNPETWLDCKLTIPLQLVFTSISSAMLVVMSVEKCFALYFPLKAKYLCTVDNAKRVTLATVIVMLLFNIPWFFTVSPVDVRQHFCCKLSFKFQRPLMTAVNYVVPQVVMVICNCAIVVKLFKKKEGKIVKQATFMQLSVTSLFILSTFPLQIVLLVTEKEMKTVCITVLLYMCNYSVNVLLYLVSGTKYREGVRKMFRIRKKRVGTVTDPGRHDNFSRNIATSANTLQVPPVGSNKVSGLTSVQPSGGSSRASGSIFIVQFLGDSTGANSSTSRSQCP